MSKNKHASALGAMGRGIKKTMSAAANDQRKLAGMASAAKRAKRNRIDIGQRFRCYRALFEALQRGEIERRNCQICGGRGQAHHEDYSRPLAVTWLCRKHHAARHKQLNGHGETSRKD